MVKVQEGGSRPTLKIVEIKDELGQVEQVPPLPPKSEKT
jgi:hypothetical protein